MKIFFCQKMSEEAERHLEEVAEVIRDWDRIGEADGILSMNLRLTSEEIDRAKNVKVIGIHGTGSDNLDWEAAKARGIECFTAPHLNARSVAELEVGLLLSLCRNIPLADRMIRGGAALSPNNDNNLKGHELYGKTFGIIGVGHIGILIGNILKYGFGMNVIGYDPFFTPERAKELDYGWCASKEDILRQADVVSLNVPLTPENRLMIGAKEFALMKPTAYFINVSRGYLVDEDALFQALKDRTIAGAATDVRWEEPPRADDRFLDLPNFVVTPHIGADTEENSLRSGAYAVDELVRRLREKGVE